MNRKKKINQTLQKHLKKKNTKLHGTNKPRYISKADRAKLEAEQAALEATTTDAEPQADNGLQQ